MRLKFFGLVVGLAICAVAGAATLVPVSTADLVSRATLVVTGTVDEVTSQPPDADGVIYSEARVRVRDAVVGGTADEYVVVRYMGGEHGGLAFVVTAEPTFEVGEEVVLFLAPAGEGVYKCPDGVQGKLSVVDGTVLPAGLTLSDYLAEVAAAAGR
jgi:hypothetical protein